MKTGRVRVRIQAYRCLVTFHVMRLADHFDAILDEPWLLRHSAYLDYKDRCVVLRKGCKRISLHCGKPAQKLSAKRAVADLSLSAMQAKKAVRKGASAMYLLVTKGHNSDKVHVSAMPADDKIECTATHVRPYIHGRLRVECHTERVLRQISRIPA